MIITLIITAIVGAVFMHNYFRVKKELRHEKAMHGIYYDASKEWKTRHEYLAKRKEEFINRIAELMDERDIKIEIIQSRDLQIIELEKKLKNSHELTYLTVNDSMELQKEITNLKKYSKGMRKLNKDMIKKYVALNNELELLTKTAPFGKGNK
jgi:hypothetical protein